jgi:hypothetical protein
LGGGGLNFPYFLNTLSNGPRERYIDKNSSSILFIGSKKILSNGCTTIKILTELRAILKRIRLAVYRRYRQWWASYFNKVTVLLHFRYW